jgi:hypothetical protein
VIRRRRVVTLAVSAVLFSACAETIDLRDTAVVDDDGPPATSAPAEQSLPFDGTLDELLPALLASWRGLDQRVIDGEAAESMARIETAWVAAAPLVRADHPASLFGLETAVELARSAVERRRPADASKGYRLAIELSDEILSR